MTDVAKQLAGPHFVEPLEQQKATSTAAGGGGLEAIVIVGDGAAGNAASEMLRREGHCGRITLLSADASRPYDRTRNRLLQP